MVTNTLSQQIESELREAVCRGKNPAYPLTLNGMAKHFDVSIQPVRTAVETLLEERWILRNAQGRLALNPKQKGKKTTPPSPTRTSQPSLSRSSFSTRYGERTSSCARKRPRSSLASGGRFCAAH